MTGCSRCSTGLLHPGEIDQALLVDKPDFPTDAFNEPCLGESAEQPADGFKRQIQVIGNVASGHGQSEQVGT